MNIYAAEFNFDAIFPIAVNSYYLKGEDNAKNTFHWHSCFEFTSIRKGKAIYYIGEKSYAVKAGDFILFNPTQYHGWEVLTETMEISAILFPYTFLQANLTTYHGVYLKAFLEGGGYFQNYIGKEDDYSNELNCCIQSLEREFSQKKSGFQLMVQADLIKILTLLTRYYVKANENMVEYSMRAEVAKRLEPAIIYIYHNYDKKITLEEMARLCYMSPNYFSAYFKKSCGCSFIQFLNELRTQKAKMQLLATDKSIMEISLDCGFMNLSNFYRIYEKFLGITPGTERKRIERNK